MEEYTSALPMKNALPSVPARWELYRLLAEPARLRLLALASEDELAVGELAELLGEVQPNVSRHVAPLRQAGLVSVRRQGTWTLVRLADRAGEDPVVADALRAGRDLCVRDGSLGRVPEVLRARERATREFFARPGRNGAQPGPPSELAAYLAALAPLLSRRTLAVDAGAGDGRLLEVLAPVFERVVAVDRSSSQLMLCRERIAQRGFGNVTVVEGELDGAELRRAVTKLGDGGADVVVAARVLHHAPRPADTVRHLAALARPGGAVVVVDYEPHADEAMRDQQADLWLGFESSELQRFAREAGLEDVRHHRVPPAWRGTGPDRHVPWQIVTGRAPAQRDDGATARGVNTTARGRT